MADIVDSSTRSRWMSGIRGKDTRPELVVRRYLHSIGFRYRLHVRHLPGCPDIVLTKHRTCIFVHGCYWHRHAGCKYATTPATRRDFWLAKLEANAQRDMRVAAGLVEAGWRVIELWECGLRGSGEPLDWLGPEIAEGSAQFLSWPPT